MRRPSAVDECCAIYGFEAVQIHHPGGDIVFFESVVRFQCFTDRDARRHQCEVIVLARAENFAASDHELVFIGVERRRLSRVVLI